MSAGKQNPCMTISSTNRKAGPYSGTGAQTAFPFAFKVFATSDVFVVRTDASGVETALQLNTDYSVALNTDQNASPGGTVTLVAAAPSGSIVTIGSSVPLTQGESIPNQGGFYPKVIENALDKLTIGVQQLAEKAARSLQFAFSDTVSGALPPAAARAGKFLAFDGIGNPTAASGAGADSALRTDLASGSAGSSLVAFMQQAPGATSRTVRDKLRDIVNVRDFGAKGDGTTDDLPAFQAAINALPAAGGRIVVPDASYLLSTAPTWGAKSIYWDFGTGVSFTGAGTGQNKFPSMKTNGGQMAVGPYIQSQSRVPYTLNNGGVAAFNVEMLQPADVVGQSVALYVGASGSNPSTSANVWAINPLIRAEAGSGGTYQCIEVDVDCFSDAALVKGISINGVGTANPDVGLELIRSDTTMWKVGLDLMNTIIGIKVRNTSGLQQGVIVGDPVAQSSVSVNSRQLSNGGDALVLQRNTDTNPLGYLLRAVDAANTTSLTTLDISGNLTTVGIVQANHITAKGAASTKPAGSFAIGSTNQQTVGPAGAAAALPAAPRGYLIGYDGPTKIVIPYYLAS